MTFNVTNLKLESKGGNAYQLTETVQLLDAASVVQATFTIVLNLDVTGLSSAQIDSWIASNSLAQLQMLYNVWKANNTAQTAYITTAKQTALQTYLNTNTAW